MQSASPTPVPRAHSAIPTPEPVRKVVAAAVAVFAERGYQSTSIQSIATRAGVAKKTVYLAARSKAELFARALDGELSRWIGRVRECIQVGSPADEMLRSIAEEGAEFLLESKLVCRLLSAIHGSEFPGWKEAVAPYRNLTRANITALLRLGVKQGRFRSDIDVEEAARIIHELQMSNMLVEAVEHGPDALRRRSAAVADMILNGITVPESRDEDG